MNFYVQDQSFLVVHMGSNHGPRSYVEQSYTQSIQLCQERAVRVHGIGPCASFLSGKRSTSELHTREFY